MENDSSSVQAGAGEGALPLVAPENSTPYTLTFALEPAVQRSEGDAR